VVCRRGRGSQCALNDHAQLSSGWRDGAKFTLTKLIDAGRRKNMGEGGVKSLESPATVRARLTSRPEFFMWNFQRAMTKKTAEKAKGGRPQHEPTPKDRQIVELLSGVGVPQKEICGLIGISLPTLHHCYRRELDQARRRFS
jgi:hypothetical protein